METRRKPPIAGKRGKRGRRNEREKKIKRRVQSGGRARGRRREEGKQCYRFVEEEEEYARAEYLKRELS